MTRLLLLLWLLFGALFVLSVAYEHPDHPDSRLEEHHEDEEYWEDHDDDYDDDEYNDDEEEDDEEVVAELEEDMDEHDFQHNYRYAKPPEYADCQDLRNQCKQLAAAGECVSNARWMHPHCPRSCKVCHNRTRTVSADQAFGAVKAPENDLPIMNAVGADVGVPQYLAPLDKKEAIVEQVEKARWYMQNIVMRQDRYQSVRAICRNLNSKCALWAAENECSNNHAFMSKQCAPVCRTCEELHIQARCPIDPNAEDAWVAGELNEMFENIVSNPEFEQQYGISVLSRPDFAVGDNEETADYELGPWVLTLDNFISDDEAELLIEIGGRVGYERSTDVGVVEEDGSFEKAVSTGRTSMNAWCESEECDENPKVIGIYERIENLTDIPYDHSESLQLLRYEPGQFYETHHDLIEYELDRVQGVRILTTFLYLNDVEEGGGTNFPELGLTVQPKRGKAVIWPSVLNEEPNRKDARTDHQALPVIKGVKYGANAWFHQRPLIPGC